MIGKTLLAEHMCRGAIVILLPRTIVSIMKVEGLTGDVEGRDVCARDTAAVSDCEELVPPCSEGGARSD
jgi:hypothetical protein